MEVAVSFRLTSQQQCRAQCLFHIELYNKAGHIPTAILGAFQETRLPLA
jgi:hypothetical protein